MATALEIIQNAAVAMHNAHYDMSPNGLIDPKQAPNDNIIFKLYNDGQLNYTKGSYAYGQRSEFTSGSSILRANEASCITFPKSNPGTSHTFCELTEEEAHAVRTMMKDYVRKALGYT